MNLLDDGSFDSGLGEWYGNPDDVDLTHDPDAGLMIIEPLSSSAWTAYDLTDPEALMLGSRYVFAATLGCETPPTGDLQMEIRAVNGDESMNIAARDLGMVESCHIGEQQVVLDSLSNPFSSELDKIRLRFDWDGTGTAPSGSLYVYDASYCRSRE